MKSSSLAPTTAENMESVKKACDKAPAGPGKDAALKHYQAAETAHSGKDKGECNRELNEARRALL